MQSNNDGIVKAITIKCFIALNRSSIPFLLSYPEMSRNIFLNPQILSQKLKKAFFLKVKVLSRVVDA